GIHEVIQWKHICVYTHTGPRSQTTNCLRLWMTLFFASCVFQFPFMHMLTFKRQIF
uniref:Uncharacterized protein n=1 Tax=Ailuropoda melanoleuca TaxID=9646 RepID=A0A7N5P8P6_AILME